MKLASTGQHRKPESWREKALRAGRRTLATSWPPPEPEPVAYPERADTEEADCAE